jgi:hypothetical protein
MTAVAKVAVEGDAGVIARIGASVAIEVRQEERIEGRRGIGLVDLGQAAGPAGVAKEAPAPGQAKLGRERIPPPRQEVAHRQ